MTMGTRERLVERMASRAHDAWAGACIKLGIFSRQAAWGEEFMVPFEELSRRGKEFDRVIMRAILDALHDAGYEVVRKTIKVSDKRSGKEK